MSSREPNDFEFELSPLRTTVNATLTAELVCDNCLPPELTVTLDASFRPVFAPEQASLRAAHQSEFTLKLTLPEGFAENATVSVAAVSPDANLQIIAASLLTRVPDSAPPDIGGYDIRAEMTHPNFLGTLTLAAAAGVFWTTRSPPEPSPSSPPPDTPDPPTSPMSATASR